MVEWGVLHTKFPGTTLRFEESGGGDEIKYAMAKVWVQFTWLPKELCEFVMIQLNPWCVKCCRYEIHQRV